MSSKPELTERTWICPEGEIYHWAPLIPIRCSKELIQNLENGMSPRSIFDEDRWKEGVDYIVPERWKVIDAIIDQFDEE
tara:strand:- start:414 stop:650 length:237 start_codon:yes stop_codon:yes gene_type:complete